jgi:hypothetical protein
MKTVAIISASFQNKHHDINFGEVLTLINLAFRPHVVLGIFGHVISDYLKTNSPLTVSKFYFILTKISLAMMLFPKIVDN